jgi:hypothetical protein
MKVYISGPITGIKDNNRVNFMHAEYRLKDLGYEVVNPLIIAKDMPNNSNWIDYMKVDIKALMDCDAIYMLKGWEKSKGATLEREIALKLEYTYMEE